MSTWTQRHVWVWKLRWEEIWCVSNVSFQPRVRWCLEKDVRRICIVYDKICLCTLHFARALDISKAFDKVNHYALLLKLMDRLVPIELLNLFESWLGNCFSYVKWNRSWSDCFNLSFGVRQGSVLAPFFCLPFILMILRSYSVLIEVFVLWSMLMILF